MPTQMDGFTVYGDIEKKWLALGGPNSFLGRPRSNENDIPGPEGGRVSSFEHGEIYWWLDTGAIELNEVLVHYTGLLCYGETDSDGMSQADEPYAQFSVFAPGFSAYPKTKVYENVDAHEGVPDVIELYRGKPRGIAISCLLLEHDYGNPENVKTTMERTFKDGSSLLAESIKYIPTVGPILYDVGKPFVGKISPLMANLLSELLGLRDDTIGQDTVTLSVKQMVTLATKAPMRGKWGVGYKFESGLLKGTSKNPCVPRVNSTVC